MRADLRPDGRRLDLCHDARMGSGGLEAQPKRFATTRWSMIANAVAGEDGGGALTSLCELYWYPLYAFVRRSGRDAEEARDLTQSFFAAILSRNDLASVDPARGRFRSWLLASMRNFLANDWDKKTAQKRGGGARLLSIDERDAEDRYLNEPRDETTPEKLYLRRWALLLLDQALTSLREECARANKGAMFDALKGTLTGGRRDEGWDELATALDMTPGALKVAAHRLKRRYREVLRETIADTVGDESVDDEIQVLISAVA
jgi:RNA polymerase sigma-70 factor (ECF subfamily)